MASLSSRCAVRRCAGWRQWKVVIPWRDVLRSAILIMRGPNRSVNSPPAEFLRGARTARLKNAETIKATTKAKNDDR